MRKKLSAKLLDHLPAAKTKRYEVRDELMPGLLVRVSVSGGRVWYLTTAVMDKPRRIKLGTYPVLSVSDARDQARKILRQIRAATRPVAQVIAMSRKRMVPRAGIEPATRGFSTRLGVYSERFNRFQSAKLTR